MGFLATFPVRGATMTTLQAYLQERRRAQVRMWIGYTAANLACIGMILLMLYV